MSKIKNGGLDQYAAGPFEQQHFGITGTEGVNPARTQVSDRQTVVGQCRGSASTSRRDDVRECPSSRVFQIHSTRCSAWNCGRDNWDIETSREQRTRSNTGQHAHNYNEQRTTGLTLSSPIPLRLCTLPYWSNPPFLIFDIRAFWRLQLQQFRTAGAEGVNVPHDTLSVVSETIVPAG